MSESHLYQQVFDYLSGDYPEGSTKAEKKAASPRMQRHIRNFCACSARILNSFQDERKTNKRESRPKPATSVHVEQVLGLTNLIFNELACGFVEKASTKLMNDLAGFYWQYNWLEIFPKLCLISNIFSMGKYFGGKFFIAKSLFPIVSIWLCLFGVWRTSLSIFREKERLEMVGKSNFLFFYGPFKHFSVH